MVHEHAIGGGAGHDRIAKSQAEIGSADTPPSNAARRHRRCHATKITAAARRPCPRYLPRRGHIAQRRDAPHAAGVRVMFLTNEQWAVLEPMLPGAQRSSRPRRGRPWRDARAVVNGILWIHRSGAPWAELPDRYPPHQTCHRRYLRLVRTGTWKRMLQALAADLAERGGMDLSATAPGLTAAGAGAAANGAGVSGPRSWQWRTALALLAPAPAQRHHPAKTRPRKRRLQRRRASKRRRAR